MRRTGILFLLLTASTTAAELTLDFNLRWRGAPLAVPSAELAGAPGQSLRFTRFAALISNVLLARADGGVLSLDGQYGCLDAESGRLSLPLRGVADGDYVGLEFQIGLPSPVNHSDPAQWAAGHALNPIVNGLHWSWAGGYVFTAIEGRWRPAEGAAAAGPGGERGFAYHLATDARLMRVRFTALFQVSGPTSLSLVLDLGKALGAHALAADDGSESTHSGADDALAAELAKAIERPWFFLEAVPRPAPPPDRVGKSRDASPGEGSATPRPFVVPPGFPQPDLPADNPLTEEGVALGELLFHDRRLSAGKVQSCASCHVEARAFSDVHATSVGVDGIAGTRNAMPLLNLAWSPTYAWDGGKPRLRDQVRAAMINPIEMHADLAVVTKDLNRDATLREKFSGAFGSPEISTGRVLLAIEQYLLSLVAADAKFDRAMRGVAQLTEEEQHGFRLFAGEYDPVRGQRGADCFHCHGGSLFTDFGFRDNGLGGAAGDPGHGAVTGRDTDRGKFKTPSLRNVALTAPYMHDGRFATLEEVIAHYDHGLSKTATLDPNLAKHPDAGLQLTAEDQRALVAFLRTLTEVKLAPSS